MTTSDRVAGRRAFLRACVGSSAGLLLQSAGGSDWPAPDAVSANGLHHRDARSLCMPRLFCTAYITPTAPGQSGQEAIVARYPLALVPQDARHAFVSWRDKVRELNPSIIMLGYQQVIEETSVPGPGHDRMREIRDAWAAYPGGFIPTVRGSTSGLGTRIYDPRRRQWQAGFLEACNATLASYPFDGLLLDQCTVYRRAHPYQKVRADMRGALQETLLRLRRQHPKTLLVGNSSYGWAGLNGELNEGRLEDMTSACGPRATHATPELRLYQSLIPRVDATERIGHEMAAAHRCGALFGVAVDYQHVLWYDFFSELTPACVH